MRLFSSFSKINKKDLTAGFISCLGQGAGSTLMEDVTFKILVGAILGVIGSVIGNFVVDYIQKQAEQTSKVKAIRILYYFLIGLVILIFGYSLYWGMLTLYSTNWWNWVIMLFFTFWFSLGILNLFFSPLTIVFNRIVHNWQYDESFLTFLILDFIIFFTVLLIGPQNIFDWLRHQVTGHPREDFEYFNIWISLFFSTSISGVLHFSD